MKFNSPRARRPRPRWRSATSLTGRFQRHGSVASRAPMVTDKKWHPFGVARLATIARDLFVYVSSDLAGTLYGAPVRDPGPAHAHRRGGRTAVPGIRSLEPASR